MEIQLYTREAAITKATVTKTTLALSKLRLFNSGFVPTQFTTKAELVAQECTFDGYTLGGYTLTAWTGPGFGGDGGGVVTSPVTNVAYGPAEDPAVTGTVGGWWIETAAGKVWLVGTIDPTRPMQVDGDAFPIIIQIVEARNAPVV